MIPYGGDEIFGILTSDYSLLSSCFTSGIVYIEQNIVYSRRDSCVYLTDVWVFVHNFFCGSTQMKSVGPIVYDLLRVLHGDRRVYYVHIAADDLNITVS